MKKVMEMTLLTLMPIRDAASLSMLTARIWPPILVLATSRSRASIVMAASKIMMICVEVTDAPRILKVFGVKSVGNGRGFGPMNGRARGKFSRNIDTPTAVIRAIMRGLLRRGRYAMASTPEAIPPVMTIAMRMMQPTASIGYVPSMDILSKSLAIKYVPSAPIIRKSPCAVLIMPTIP